MRGTFREDEQSRKKRIILTMMLHAGSVMIALGIAIAILGTPDRIWGIFAIAIGVVIWLRVFRCLAVESGGHSEKEP